MYFTAIMDTHISLSEIDKEERTWFLAQHCGAPVRLRRVVLESAREEATVKDCEEGEGADAPAPPRPEVPDTASLLNAADHYF